MGLRINHNTAALNGHRNLLHNDGKLSNTLERLSSGMKINRAADGSAGLVISEQMRAQITGLAQAIDNSSTAVSMVQTAEGAMDEVNTLLNKARQLVLHAANTGANDSNQLAADQAELDQVVLSITRISEFAQFGTKKLLDGNMSGAGDLSTGLNRVRVGNLANNASIQPGTATIVVNGGTQEANTLRGGTPDDGYLFTIGGGTVSGVNVGTGVVNSGVIVTLRVGEDTVTYTTPQQQTPSQVATSLNELISGYTVSFSSASAGFTVTRDVVGATDFAASISFSKGAVPTTAEVEESITASVQLTTGQGSESASVIFTGYVGAFSGINENTAVTTGTVFTATIAAADGSTGASFAYTATGGATVLGVMNSLAALVAANTWTSLGLSGGTTLTFVGGYQDGFQARLNRPNGTNGEDFNFTLEVDWTNSVTDQPEIRVANLSGLALVTSGGTSIPGTSTFVDNANGGVSGNAAVSGATTFLSAGAAISMTINGVTEVVVGAGQSLDQIASTLNTRFATDGFQIRWLDPGDATSGTVFEDTLSDVSITGGTGSFSGGAGFYVVSTDGSDFSMSLSIDNIVGLDTAATSTEVQAGSLTVATLNLDTVAQERTEAVAAVTGHVAATIGNIAAQTLNGAGADVTATLTTSNGVAIGLTQALVTASGSVRLGLDASALAAGFERFRAELSTGITSAGGVVTFTLSEGAVFQVGPNNSQKVGVTIESTAASELGRNVPGAGRLLSLADLASTSQGALINGMTDEALKVIDAAIDEVTNMRGRLGAVQSNTLETGLNSLRATSENLTNAESVIRDADFAAESAEFTRYNILVQSSTAMLAQANQLPQNVLRLIQQ